jgi:superfamily I DNA and/or RNA helicase
VKSDEASRKGLSLSLFERVMALPDVVSTMLDEQYRMNSLIMNWSSNAMYKGGLKAHASVSNRTMSDLYTHSQDELLHTPLMLVDTAGALMHESVDEQS